jgi:hypothetical protein
MTAITPKVIYVCGIRDEVYAAQSRGTPHADEFFDEIECRTAHERAMRDLKTRLRAIDGGRHVLHPELSLSLSLSLARARTCSRTLSLSPPSPPQNMY